MVDLHENTNTCSRISIQDEKLERTSNSYAWNVNEIRLVTLICLCLLRRYENIIRVFLLNPYPVLGDIADGIDSSLMRLTM